MVLIVKFLGEIRWERSISHNIAPFVGITTGTKVGFVSFIDMSLRAAGEGAEFRPNDRSRDGYAIFFAPKSIFVHIHSNLSVRTLCDVGFRVVFGYIVGKRRITCPPVREPSIGVYLFCVPCANMIFQKEIRFFCRSRRCLFSRSSRNQIFG